MVANKIPNDVIVKKEKIRKKSGYYKMHQIYIKQNFLIW